MSDEICKNCQYYRAAYFLPHVEHPFCSNLKSPKSLTDFIKEHDTCKEFYKRGQKSPLWMRLTNEIMKRINP